MMFSISANVKDHNKIINKTFNKLIEYEYYILCSGSFGVKFGVSKFIVPKLVASRTLPLYIG